MPVLRSQSVPFKQGRPPLDVNVLPHGNLSKDLTLCYLFNSAPSNFLIDCSPYRHDSNTIQNLTTNYWLPADEGHALSLFSGAAQRVNCRTIPKLHGATQASIAVWFKRHSAASTATVGRGGFNLDALDNNTIYMSMDGVYGSFDDSDNTTAWKLVVFTFDGSRSSNEDKLKGYENGIQKGLLFNGSLPTIINNDSFNSFFVNYSTEYGVYGDALYKFVAMWNRVLNPFEIQQLYEDQTYSWLSRSKYIKIGTAPAPPPYLNPYISEFLDIRMCVNTSLEHVLEL